MREKVYNNKGETNHQLSLDWILDVGDISIPSVEFHDVEHNKSDIRIDEIIEIVTKGE